MIGNLRKMVQDTDAEIERQNRKVDGINLKVSLAPSRGQSYKKIYTLGSIYKDFLRLDNML